MSVQHWKNVPVPEAGDDLLEAFPDALDAAGTPTIQVTGGDSESGVIYGATTSTFNLRVYNDGNVSKTGVVAWVIVRPVRSFKITNM